MNCERLQLGVCVGNCCACCCSHVRTTISALSTVLYMLSMMSSCMLSNYRDAAAFSFLCTSLQFTMAPLPSGASRSIILLLLASSLLYCAAFAPPSLRSSPSSATRSSPSTQRTTLLHARSGKKKTKPKDNTIAVNRLAYRNYEIIDTLEAGISLKGSEVKSIRDGKMNLRDGYVRPSKNGRSCTLYNVHIGKHTMTSEYFQHEERRPRPLLVHKEQACKLLQQTEQQGMTIVPVKAYYNEDNRIKVQIALCKGKNVRDKRQTIKERDAKREERRIIKNFRL